MHKSQRLLRLFMLINARKSFTIGELATELGVSKRTISRDLMDLSELGVPIYSIQGRGGGFKLLNEKVLPPIAFSESEAIAIFFACQSLRYFGAIPFGDGAKSALAKFYHYLPADIKEQIDRLTDKVIIWSPNRSMSSACLQVFLQAIMIRCAITIEYDSGGNGAETRDIQPIGLYSDNGYWYCPAYCFARGAYRLFRADRVLSAKLNKFIECREEVDRKSVFDWQTEDMEDPDMTTLCVSLTAAGVKKLEPNGRFTRFINYLENGGGTVRLSIPRRKLPFYLEMIWGLGHDAKILEPEEAVNIIRQNIDLMKQQYD